MSVVAHVSDLHFGREDARLAAALVRELEALRPDLVVVSGDLTQRARRRQFAAARAFLDRIPFPLLPVPGNHDIPLFDVLRRAAAPLRRYRRWIAAEVDPIWIGAGLGVLGLNTARALAWKDGRLSRDQIRRLRERLEPLAPEFFKVLVTHHPFIPPPSDPRAAIVGRGTEALLAAAAGGVDLLLAGHLHLGYSGDVRHHHVTVGRSMVAVQAGTAISTRVREHPNGYNVLRLDPRAIDLEVRSWEGNGYRRVARSAFRRRGEEWRPDA